MCSINSSFFRLEIDHPLEQPWKNKLRLVRIYFDTPTIDRIERDRAEKFVDILSAIGGTLGLLTGFSIISGIEILYFTVKILWNILEKGRIGRMFLSSSAKME